MKFAIAAQCVLTALLSAADNSPGEALIDAVQNDDRAAVESLLGSHADVNARQDDGATALAWAAVRCNRDIAALLLKAGANANLVNEQGVSPLYLAMTNGATDVAKLLLASGADPNLARADGETPLMTAARLGQVEVMKILLDRGADVNAREKRFGQTAVMWAAGHPEGVRLLVEHGADVHATSKTWDITSTIYTPTTSTIGKTGIPWNNDGVYTSKQGGQNAIHFAVEKHDLESVRILLGAGVYVNIRSADGTTPLLAALYKWDPLGQEFIAGKGAPAPAGSSAHFGGDVEMARLLLDHGASAEATDGAGYTPLHGAALTVAVITTAGRDRSAYGNGRAVRRTPGSGPARPVGNPEEALTIVSRLLDAGADPNRQTRYPTSGPVGDVRINPAPPGSSPFHIAANSDCLELVKLLADHGASPNLPRKDGHTPFSVAVLSMDVSIVKDMVARGADLKARYSPTDHYADPVKPISLPRTNQTIMHIAAGARAPEVVEYLFSQGVPLDAKNGSGETPLDLADEQERFREAIAREAAEDKPDRTVKRDTSTTDAIKKLLAGSATADGRQ
jgi:ankyrin repeat protein